jgi:hypothetical protein
MVQGGVRFIPPGRVAGYCNLPDRPGYRATVDILVDGQPAVAMVAAQRFDGAGDGRHGFSVTLPAPVRGQSTHVIECRERGSGQIFARVVVCPEQIAQPFDARLAKLDTSVLRAPMPAQSARHQLVLRQSFRELGDALLHKDANPWQQARQRLARRLPRLALSGQPGLGTPAVSVILPAAPAVDATLTTLVALQPLCDAMPTEILIADGGTDPRTLLLAPLLPGLRYVRCDAALPGHALNMLAAEARGATLCFVGSQPPPGPWAWPQFSGSGGSNGAAVHLGCEAAAAFHLRGPWQTVVRRTAPSGMAVHLGRGQWREAGGFDPALSGTAAYADLALKCALLGTPVLLWLNQSA